MALGLCPSRLFSRDFCGCVCTGANGFGQGRTQAVEMIGPPCHHLHALRPMFCPVIGSADWVAFSMGKLPLNNIRAEHAFTRGFSRFVEEGARKRSETLN